MGEATNIYFTCLKLFHSLPQQLLSATKEQINRYYGFRRLQALLDRGVGVRVVEGIGIGREQRRKLRWKRLGRQRRMDRDLLSDQWPPHCPRSPGVSRRLQSWRRQSLGGMERVGGSPGSQTRRNCPANRRRVEKEIGPFGTLGIFGNGQNPARRHRRSTRVHRHLRFRRRTFSFLRRQDFPFRTPRPHAARAMESSRCCRNHSRLQLPRRRFWLERRYRSRLWKLLLVERRAHDAADQHRYFAHRRFRFESQRTSRRHLHALLRRR